MQRMFIKKEPTEANVPRKLYDNFKIWVEREYPNGIAEDEWEDIVAGDSYQVI